MSDLEQVQEGIRIAATNGLIRQMEFTRDQAERTFDRWLNAERARIWNQGFGTGERSGQRELPLDPLVTNPYL